MTRITSMGFKKRTFLLASPPPEEAAVEAATTTTEGGEPATKKRKVHRGSRGKNRKKAKKEEEAAAAAAAAVGGEESEQKEEGDNAEEEEEEEEEYVGVQDGERGENGRKTMAGLKGPKPGETASAHKERMEKREMQKERRAKGAWPSIHDALRARRRSLVLMLLLTGYSWVALLVG
jgi:hypothetical protein